jgi:uncharacterized protein YbjT (DUF2867 family)
VLREGYEDMQAMEDRVLASSLEWTIVRPPRLTDAPHSGKIAASVDGNVRGAFSIGRADLADYLLRAATGDSLTRTAVSVATGR